MSAQPPQTELPFIFIPEVYHAGNLTIFHERVEPLSGRNCDFELGLLPVSLDPAEWAARSPLESPTIYKLTSDGLLKLLDADWTVANYADRIIRDAVALRVAHISSGQLQGTATLWATLQISQNSMPNGGGKDRETWLLNMCLAVLARGDASIDGVWWTNLHQGAFATQRGGLYQHRLGMYPVAEVDLPDAATPGASQMRPTVILP
ncbi:hypothetical protein [Microvirga sp. Mcv34]|uniref:hypothetical protein n=1 Tax=Microvirga sp. Mcv34 TaxID=2926016 RepID=UPI0021C5CA57|nr:hypothetical protein [Microvirga sp. Mcv34]